MQCNVCMYVRRERVRGCYTIQYIGDYHHPWIGTSQEPTSSEQWTLAQLINWLDMISGELWHAWWICLRLEAYNLLPFKVIPAVAGVIIKISWFNLIFVSVPIYPHPTDYMYIMSMCTYWIIMELSTDLDEYHCHVSFICWFFLSVYMCVVSIFTHIHTWYLLWCWCWWGLIRPRLWKLWISWNWGISACRRYRWIWTLWTLVYGR